MAAYLYYQRDESVISDAENDKYCLELVQKWEQVPVRYKPLLDPDVTQGLSLMATSYHCKFTLQIEAGALAWLEQSTGRHLHPLPKKGSNFTTGAAVEDAILMHEMGN